VKELLLRKVLQLLLIEAGVTFVALYGAGEYWRQPRMIATLLISIFVVYVAATLISWVGNMLSAKALDRELTEFQKMNE
jgi:hypothetical protein